MTENRFPLTNAWVKSVVNSTGAPLWLYDSKLPGFAVTVSPHGRKVFYFCGRVRGRPKRIKIGLFPALTVDEARKACKSIVGDVAAGKSLRERQRAGRATVADLFAHFLEVHAKPRKRTWERDVVEFDRLIRAELGDTPLLEVHRSDVAKLIARIEVEHSAGSAHKARALLSAMFEIGIRDEWCEHNPVRKTHRPQYEPRQRYLKAGEVSRFLDAVEKLQRPVTRAFFKLCLFTGARRANVAAMRWDELDLSAGLWVIPASKFKGKRPQVIPLIPEAVEILRERERLNPDGCPWVLPGQSRQGHLTDPKAAVMRLRELTGIKDLRTHDLRRTLGAWQQRQGDSLRTIQQTMGHATIDVTARVYSAVDTEQVRQSIAAVVAKMRGAK